MRNILVIGGSKGIGHEIVKSQLEKGNKCYNFSRTQCDINHVNFKQEVIDINIDELPPIEELDSIVYCPGSINLKPILQLKEEDFLNDFNINVMGDYYEIILESKNLIKNLFVSSSSDYNFSDNYFDLLPNQTKTIKIKRDKFDSMSLFKENLSFISLYDTY